MTTKTMGDEVCPYSEPPYADFTDDHIFPEFLGGRESLLDAGRGAVISGRLCATA